MKAEIKIALLVFLIGFTTSLFSQDFWEELYFPDSLNISDIKVNSAGEIFVGTATPYQDNGIFRSGDNGQTWEMILNNKNIQIYSFSINEQGHIFASTGGFYPLRASFNNGVSWDTIPMPFSVGIGKIEFLGQDTILLATALSNGAILLSTSDLGMSWDTLFMTENNTSEYVADIALASNGDICIGLGCFMPDMGGLYKSTNGGSDWEFLGLFNRMVQNLEYNTQGDLIIGVRGGFDGSGGIFAIYHNNPDQIVECYAGPNVNGLTLNSAGHIYAGTAWPDGVAVSLDNGVTFNFENGGLPIFPIGKMERDNDDYIYALLDGPSNLIYRSKYATVTGINQPSNCDSVHNLIIYSNPVYQEIRGFINHDTSDGMYDYTITDMTGKQLLSNQLFLAQSTFSLNVSFLSKGLFVLNIFDNKYKYSAKIIKN